jgi:hypothetical protein
MIADVSIRLLYLIFSRLLSWLTLLPRRRPRTSSLWVPETVHTALDLLLRRWPATGMIRRWRYN